MVSVISLRVREVLDGAAFAHLLGERLAVQTPVPLLVLRVPDFAEEAWRSSKRIAHRFERQTTGAFRAAAARILRDGDAIAHDEWSDRFIVGMFEPARGWPAVTAIDARSALERIAVAMSLSSGRRMETGWWPVTTLAEARDLGRTIDLALERGARERERYEFLATVGHELRTPLSSIRGYIETLLDSEIDRATSRRFLETARHEALRLGRLVDGMLEFSLLDLSPASCAGAWTDISARIDGAIKTLEPLAARASVTLRSTHTHPLHARLDGDACIHALLNLIENAIKHGAPGGTIELSARERDGFVEVAVDDDGPGVPDAERERIFGMRVRGAGAVPGGSGIGLRIVKTIAERAGGEVRVARSKLGGSQFIFRVPAAAPSQAELRSVLS